MAERAYFDWNATAPLRAEARAAMLAAMELAGNASSVHAEGRAARRLIEDARAQVATLVGAEPRHVTFTSGATEANMLALQPIFDGQRLFVSAVEHPSVRCGGCFRGNIAELAVDSDGVVDLDGLARALAGAERPLVSVMLANNETGVIQPIRQIADIVHAAGGLLHVDAVQGPGRIDCRLEELGADLVSLSAHKLGGPQGAGALIRGSDIRLQPLIRGGGQERGLRAGTENVAAIAGFGAACAAVAGNWRSETAHMAALRQRIEAGVRERCAQAVIFGDRVERLPSTTLFAVPGLKAETALIAFDLNGIALSSGSACSSGKVQASHVLAAMGVELSLARAALRISTGYATTEEDVEKLLNALTKAVSSLLKNYENPGLSSGLPKSGLPTSGLAA